MPATSLPQLFDDDINLKGLLDIVNPKNNLVLADDMMLSDADGIILRVSENYEQNFGFTHESIPALRHSGGHPAEEKDHRYPDHQSHPQKRYDRGHPAL